jgi:hypothetical protein
VKGTNLEITSWFIAKHVHHDPDFRLDPTEYEMSQADLDNIRDKGLINHINQGGTVPKAEYIKSLQKRWKRFAEHKDVRDCGIQTVLGEECHVVKHDRTRFFLSFKADSGESYTGYQLTPRQSNPHNRMGLLVFYL